MAQPIDNGDGNNNDSNKQVTEVAGDSNAPNSPPETEESNVHPHQPELPEAAAGDFLPDSNQDETAPVEEPVVEEQQPEERPELDANELINMLAEAFDPAEQGTAAFMCYHFLMRREEVQLERMWYGFLDHFSRCMIILKWLLGFFVFIIFIRMFSYLCN